MGWDDRALCSDLMNDTFYPSEGANKQALLPIYRICHACPVKLECRVLGIGEQHGVWGNSSPVERRAYRVLFRHLMPKRDGYDWDVVFRRWSYQVLDAVDKGMDLVVSMRKYGASDHEIRSLFALTNGDRMARRDELAREFEQEQQKQKV